VIEMKQIYRRKIQKINIHLKNKSGYIAIKTVRAHNDI